MEALSKEDHFIHQCVCGRDHVIPIRLIEIDENMLNALSRYLKSEQMSRILIIADENANKALGQEVFEQLERVGLSPHAYVFPGSVRLLPDEQAIDKVKELIRTYNVEVVLAVGGGVINDIVRYTTFLERIRYISIPTAPSGDAFTSNVAPLLLNGLKITKQAQTPEAIFTKPSVLCAAPWVLIQSGFGDLIAKITALSDWKLSCFLYGEYFCNKAYQLVRDSLIEVIQHVEELLKREAHAVKMLFAGLVQSGVAIAMADSPRPASGSEHHCSHLWDFFASRHLREYAPHGIQVGYAAHWMMEFYSNLDSLKGVIEPQNYGITKDWQREMQLFYGTSANEIIDAQMQKQEWMEARRGCWKTNHPTLEQLLQLLKPEMELFAQVKQALTTMGIPWEIGYIGVDEAMLRDTFVHAKELRSRYTILDFLQGQGELQRFIDDVLQKAREAPHI
ncbi:sn-glycerol-1-phosphate dehydrogenase [Paenibacillus thalictri]|uniref:Iron-containing alcohol dehydrogenase n=1 Tax=Paenibacillus thalictri TaxID=2527873 RepID=A0A4Q9DQJ2_9BACL|nr:sn-glycerol-1-phosphate dehydrogenase [Paenibacillus thalictri]TBL76366.1 iron-containing alcohol dehydrogenase [Paenibacillus thalictri]